MRCQIRAPRALFSLKVQQPLYRQRRPQVGGTKDGEKIHGKTGIESRSSSHQLVTLLKDTSHLHAYQIVWITFYFFP
jgi:hypothetical protein